MEILEIPGYTRREKLAIARQHLIPKQLEEHGITQEQLDITDTAVDIVIDHYTREAGVRTLERQIASVIRGVAVKIAEGDTTPAQGRRRGAGPRVPRRRSGTRARSRSAPRRRASRPGSRGRASAARSSSSRRRGCTAPGKLQLTGQLGDVMKESAQAALSATSARTPRSYGIAKDFLEKSDIHIHIPAGGMPKDGPSAGVTMFTALVSMLTGIRVRHDVAMTGEITLRGRVLPIGGLKEKVLAAHRAGIKRVIVPERNKADLDEVPAEVKNDLEFVFVSKMDQVLEAALEEMPKPKPEAPPAQATPPSN